MSSDFYRAFEDRHRGSREIILARLAVYRPFVEPFRNDPNARVLDLGCGRGEWLELLGHWGLKGRGVDLDEAMLAEARAAGAEVAAGDALAALRASADNSLALVSAFHLVEHLPFDQLYQLITEAERVLQPGGLLILETPNPENFVVGTTSFYLDPTHQRPLPPDLLAFVPEHVGFPRIKKLRLQERPGLLQQPVVNLGHVLRDVSPDYAVIAQKSADGATLELFDSAFSVEHGVTADQLIDRFDAGLAQRWQQLESRVERLEAELAAIYRSRSWRITRPLRAGVGLLRRIRGEEPSL